MRILISASAMQKGQEGLIRDVKGEQALNRRLRDMGLRPGIRLSCRERAPLGDPIEFELMNYRLTIRKSEAEGVLVEVEG